ncbi:hypothetical protein GMLC_14890 [Geomonas limicola]|uniref:Uncharacterized protein n=1 Tax=Geomonas limicola TaxID=2740186 RepID=A0A6V8N682_9BACT|nr:hypothetical protein [Geomonas limicola]GFO67910.1 hypothetical protein GMLC_14890 [Geomonas limicola]
MPCHSECKYHGFLGLEEWCRHPEHIEPLKPARQFAIMAAGGKCANWLAWEAKVMPHETPSWPMPVVMLQIVAVFAVYLHQVSTSQASGERSAA